ncbi:MAG: hypothetical protein Q7S42_03350 [Candidatus Omnitrophota bacterium]|nr:hypothetical protein [Candidatus Omnitrophota bacterium]
MVTMLRNQKAQAVLELAILGSIIIAAFAILISYSEKFNSEQSYMQQTFRAALKKAQQVNNSASWATVDFRRMPNVTNPMEIGKLAIFNSSSKVLWSDGKKDGSQETKAKSYFELNRNTVVEIPISEEAGPQEGEVSTSSFGYTSVLSSGTKLNKQESGDSITTQKSLNATDSIGGHSDIGDTTVDLGGDLGADGKYIGGGLSRGTNMQ